MIECWVGSTAAAFINICGSKFFNVFWNSDILLYADSWTALGRARHITAV